MKISTILRHFREGSKSLVRNGWMTFASVSAISISLFILGVFLLLSLNVNYLSKQIEKQVEIRVYLEVNTPEAEVTSLQNEIAAISEVSRVKFVSKEEGIEFLREKLGESGETMLEGFEGDNNPLNDSFTVEADDPYQVPQVAEQIEALNEGKFPQPIYKVSYGKGTVETLFKVTAIIRNVGLALVAGLALTAMFLIANTIKLTILARSREISIMKLVGATNHFIRWPFFIEGFLLGIFGSIIPVGLILYGYWELIKASQAELSEMSLLMIKLKPFEEVSLVLTLLLICIGTAIGVWGTIISVRKFLKV